MKKTLNVVLAVVLAVAMIASFAYVATPEKSSEYQLSLVSAKAVNVQDTTQGVRSYADLIDASRIYQVNEVIYLAITSEVKNLEKYPKLKTIEDKDIKVVVGSPSIDLSYSKLTTPTLLANVWSGYTATDVATVGYLAPAGTMLSYDKAANEVSWTFRGVAMYGMTGNASKSVNMNLVTFDPYFDTAKKKIEIPAIKIKDKDTTWSLGGTKFDTKYEAPGAIGYTMVLTGVTKDNAGAQKGTFYAKIQISAAEKFEDCGQYYLLSDGTYTDVKPTTREWLDFVKIDVDKLEIAGGYSVYKYFVPSSAVMRDAAMYYNGNESTLNGNKDKDLFVDAAAVVAHVNPQLFDNATNRTEKIGNTLTAGGVKTVKAYETFKAGETGAAMKEYPMTSVIYSNNKAYYAPGFYGGTLKWGAAATASNGGTNSTDPVDAYEGTGVKTETVKVVEYFDLAFKGGSAEFLNFDAEDIMILWSDTQTSPSAPASPILYLKSNSAPQTQTTIAQTYDNAVTGAFNAYTSWPFPTKGLDVTEVMGDPTGNVNYQMIQNGSDYICRLYPSSALSLNLAPLNKTKIESGDNTNGVITQSMVVYYRNANYTWSEGVARANGFQTHSMALPTGSNVRFLAPASFVTGATTPTYCPVFTEKTKDVTVQVATSGLSFTGLTQNWGVPVSIIRDDQITAVRANISYSWTGDNLAAIAPATGRHVFEANLNIPMYNFVGKTLPTGTALASYNGLANSSAALTGHKTYAAPYNVPVGPNVVACTGGTTAFVYGFQKISVGKDSTTGLSVVTLGDLVRYNPVTLAWEPCDVQNFLSLPTDLYFNGTTGTTAGYAINPGPTNALSGSVGSIFATSQAAPAFTSNMTVKGEFTFFKEAGKDADPFYYSYDSATAAPYSLWDDGNNSIVEAHNGITVYSVVSFEDERPYVAMATETAYFDSDDGYGIALFDGYNLKDGVNTMAKRIYRTNASNLAYSDGATHVPDSAKIISALSYFGLDTSFDTTYRVTKEVFEAKGAAAVFSEAVEGSFNYGTITIVSEQVDEGAEEEDVPTDDVEETPDVTEPEDSFEPEVSEDIEEPETPDVGPTSAPVPPTGDASANVAIALAGAAIVAAAGLAFVMKRAR